MKPILLALVVVLSLTGCALDPRLSASRDLLVAEAAKVSDAAVDDAVFTICRAITVGSWRRKFGADPQRAAAWKALCAEPLNATPQ